MIIETKYESGVRFSLIQTPMGDGSFCYDIDIETSTSSIRFSMESEYEARKLWKILTESPAIVEVSTDDMLPDPGF